MILFNDENAGKYPVSKPEHNPDNTLQVYDPLKTFQTYTCKENAGKYPVSKTVLNKFRRNNPDNTLQMYDPLKTFQAYTRRESNNKTSLFLPGTFFFIIFSLFYFSALPLFAERTQTAKQMTLQQNTATIRVEYEPTRKSIAEYSVAITVFKKSFLDLIKTVEISKIDTF